jgi:hypothetical protein
MAEKVAGRWRESRISGTQRDGIELIVTRKGVEVYGSYDGGYGGQEPLHLSWAEVDAMRTRVNEGNETND